MSLQKCRISSAASETSENRGFVSVLFFLLCCHFKHWLSKIAIWSCTFLFCLRLCVRQSCALYYWKKKKINLPALNRQTTELCLSMCMFVRQIQCKLTRRLLLCLPTSRLLATSAAERWRDKQTPAATCICTAFLVFNSPQLTVSIVTGWEELKTEKDIQDIRARRLQDPLAVWSKCPTTDGQ